MSSKKNWVVRPVTPADFEGIQDLCLRVYPFTKPWNIEQLKSHDEVFRDGQLIACDPDSGRIVGFAFSLIVNWEDYTMQDSWRDFTDAGYFTNHDPEHGRTLYGAEIMTDPELRGQGVGKALYEARRQLCEKLKLLRIRAGARMRGYHVYADELSPEEYLLKVAQLKIFDPTISFQIKRGFKPLAVVPQYLQGDPESLGYAAVIEWINPQVATAQDFEKQKQRFEKYVIRKIEEDQNEE